MVYYYQARYNSYINVYPNSICDASWPAGSCLYASGVTMSGTLTDLNWALPEYISTGSSGYLCFGAWGIGCDNYIYFYTTVTTYTCPITGNSCSGPGTCYQYYGCNNTSYGYYSCPSGYSLSGSTCIANPTCGSGGSLNISTSKCQITPSFTCASGFTYDSGSGRCVASASCSSGGVLNTTSDVCRLSQINSCPSGYTYDSTNSVCQSAVVCNPGTFNSTLGTCEVQASTLCPSEYAFNSSDGKCEQAPVCPSGSTYSNAADECLIAANYQCPTDTTCSPTLKLCEAIPICTSGVYDTTYHGCNEGANICPLGNYACLANANGINQCSPNPCVDTTTTQAQITKVDDTMLQDDGPRDANGNCLGQIFLFTGRGERCRPSGYDTGFHNCCAKSQGAVKDSNGSIGNTFGAVKGAIGGVYTAYQIVNAASAASRVGSNAGDIIKFSSVNGIAHADVYEMTPGPVSLPTLTESFDGNAASSLQGVYGGMGSDTAAATSIQNFAQQVGPQLALAAITMAIPDPNLSSLVNLVGQCILGAGPVGVGLAVVQLAMSVFSEKCDQQDIEVSTLNDSKYCHFVGSYCDTKWPLIGCVQKANGYCCFNSKLGRIIQEQGRPQLKDFQPDGAWGTGQAPNCKGFTPEQFQMIDFSKVDMSEYFNDLQTQAIGTIQQNVTDKVQQFYQNIR